MRLWHEALIPYLPRQQLLGQHRECCALRGLGWGKKHATVDYAFRHPYSWLVAYHWSVMREMEKRGYKPAKEWKDSRYHGKLVGCLPSSSELLYGTVKRAINSCTSSAYIYPEHNEAYLKECLENLKRKGIVINANFESV